MTKILVIDDDDLVRNMVCNALRKADFEVLEACNGREGIKKAEREKPDVLITDMIMPEKEGIQTILEIQALNHGVKIIAMSGGGAAKNMSRLHMAQRAGAHRSLKKPFKQSDLLDAVNAVLSD